MSWNSYTKEITMVSIKDVAKEAGVSVTTVSRVINNSGYIGKETRKKVEKLYFVLEYPISLYRDFRLLRKSSQQPDRTFVRV
jgi:DNA-binding LacI/PurR family transcriptional regulator